MEQKKPLFLIIDGNSLAYRGFFAFRKNPLLNSKGKDTSGSFAFTNSLMKLLRTYNPQHVALVFDAKGPTLRHKYYKEYKATRPKMPDELHEQIEWIKEISKSFNFIIYEVSGYEADDVMATLAKKAKKLSLESILVTSDKDLLQMVDEDILILDTRPKEDILYTKETVKEHWGVPPGKIPDMLALTGDAIDNIPGIPGIGPKNATELLTQFESLEKIYSHLKEITKESLRKTLEDFQEQAMLSYKLAVLETDVPIEWKPKDTLIKPPLKTKLFQIFRELEFTSLLKEFADFPEELPIQSSVNWKALANGFVLVSLGDEFLVANALPGIYKTNHRELQTLLEDPNIPKWVYSAKNVYKQAITQRIIVQGIAFDLLIATYLLDPAKSNYDLDSLALEYLGLKLHPASPLREAEEILVILKLKDQLIETLDTCGLLRLYQEIELPLAYVLAKMELRGTIVDKNKLEDLGSQLKKEIEKLETTIYHLAQEEFNLNSSRQLAYILFEKLAIPPLKKTKTGFSTDQEVLEKLSEKHELPKYILEYRELFKIYSTYVVSLLELRDKTTGRVYPTFHETGTVTGRLSCSDPNLQNIPIRSELSRVLREAFCVPRGYLLLSADYSQIELRILAHLSGDEALKRAFEQDEDIHKNTAQLIFKYGKGEVSEIDRRRAKVVNFGIIYGMSPFGLAKELAITPEEASMIITGYFASYPGVKIWMEETLRSARKHGFVSTILGRRRYLPEIKSDNQRIRELQERMAINTCIQGSAADLIKKAMVDIDRELTNRGLHSGIILQIHDELLLEVKEEELEEVKEIVKHKMEAALILTVPLKIKLGVGNNWYASLA